MDSKNNQIEEIKDRLDVAQVIEKYVKLKKTGKNFSGLCPFHTEKTPSFIVSPDLQRYKCFGCGETGDIFNFIQKIENVDFPESLEKLAKEAGVMLEKKKTNYKYKVLEEINYNAAKYYYNELKKDKNALQYLLDRGVTKKSIKEFGIGYAPQRPKLREYLFKTKKYNKNDLVNSGLFNIKEGKTKEKFYDRIMFPIRSKKGSVIAFTGRVLPGNKWGPKYMNSPDTPIFHKKDNLFGQYESRQEIRKNDLAIICEGSTDVISAHQHGLKNVVAPLGTGLTKEQLEKLSLLTENILFFFDSDEAGNSALIRGFKIASELKLNPYAANPKPYKDLDDLLQKDPDRINDIVKNKKEAFSFIISNFMSNKNLNRLEDISLLKNFIGPLFEAVKDPSTRKLYSDKVSKMLKIKVNSNPASSKNSNPNCYKPDVKILSHNNYYKNYIKYLLLSDDLKSKSPLPSKYMEPGQYLEIYKIILENDGAERTELYDKIRDNDSIAETFENIIFDLSDIPNSQEEIDKELKTLEKRIIEDYYRKKQKELSVKIAIAEENNDAENSEKYLKKLIKISKLLKNKDD